MGVDQPRDQIPAGPVDARIGGEWACLDPGDPAVVDGDEHDAPVLHAVEEPDGADDQILTDGFGAA